MRFRNLLWLATLSLLPGFVNAQDSAGMTTRSLHFAFITPVGSNGLNSGRVINKFSINLLAGYSGGLNGVEFSGLGSVLKGEMKGAQFSGLGNLVLQNTTGVQFSGLYNIGLKRSKAAEFAGLINFNGGSFKGLQTAGFTNIIVDSATGMQLAGFCNYGAGCKISQVSGFINVSSRSNRGMQLAGFININSGRMSGLQVAGLINYATRLRGTQIGVFNYVDSLERGVPVGFLTVVRNGFSALEIGATESLFGVVSYKTGVKQFYNILSVGGGSRNGLTLFAWGYGLGAFIPLGQTTGLSIDGICYQVNENEWYTDRLNLLNKLTVSGSWKVASHLSLFGGLSWNVTVADITDQYGDGVTSNISPWSVFTQTYEGHLQVKMYPGISAGIRL